MKSDSKKGMPAFRVPGLERSLRMGKILGRTRSYYRRVKCIQRAHGSISREVLDGFKVEWAQEMFSILRISITSQGIPVTQEPVIFAGNHISYLDIPLLMTLAPVVFVAKKQLARWPVFGPAASLLGTVFVDRDSKDSRQMAADAIAPAVQKGRQSVVLFPSGTTSIKEEKPWRWGVFRIAADAGIPVQPFRIRYTPLRRAGYLMEDLFYSHLWNLLDGTPLAANVEFHPPTLIEDVERDAKRWHEWAREGL